jgi:cytochrome c-type biogenesis protein CcmH
LTMPELAGRIAAIRQSHYLPIMLFWLICAALTLAAVAAALKPLAHKPTATVAAGINDLEVYKDQLRELEQDAGRGLIGVEEANAARLEISRRILKADAQASAGNSGNPASAKLAVVMVLFVPAVAWVGYLATGSPQIPDQPIAMRMQAPAENASIEVLLAKTEAHLAANPQDGKGWDVIAPVYLRLGQFDKSAVAFRKTLEINGPAFKSEIGLGEALAGLNNGMIGPDSEAAFRRAAALDPANPQPAIMLATAKAQRGEYVDAKSAFEAILANAPQDAPWRAIVQQSIAGIDVAMSQPGPTGADIDAASQMSAGDRTAMIETMVAGLDEKLKANPADKDGWLRLIRSYTVLGKTDKALEALQRAETGLAANATGLSEIKALAAELGLKTP